MYVWELVSCRLRGDGWDVWHTSESDASADGPLYTVRLRRPGQAHEVSGPTLTEAYAAAARRAREHATPAPRPPIASPHFPRAAFAVRG